MLNARFRVMAGLAGATLCLFAVTTYAQTPATTGNRRQCADDADANYHADGSGHYASGNGPASYDYQRRPPPRPGAFPVERSAFSR